MSVWTDQGLGIMLHLRAQWDEDFDKVTGRGSARKFIQLSNGFTAQNQLGLWKLFTQEMKRQHPDEVFVKDVETGRKMDVTQYVLCRPDFSPLVFCARIHTMLCLVVDACIHLFALYFGYVKCSTQCSNKFYNIHARLFKVSKLPPSTRPHFTSSPYTATQCYC